MNATVFPKRVHVERVTAGTDRWNVMRRLRIDRTQLPLMHSENRASRIVFSALFHRRGHSESPSSSASSLSFRSVSTLLRFRT